MDFNRIPIEVRQTTNIPSAIVSSVEAEEDATDGSAAPADSGLQQDAGSGAATTFTVLGHIFMLMTFAAAAFWAQKWWKEDNSEKQRNKSNGKVTDPDNDED